MASQTNGESTEQRQGTAKGNVNRPERPRLSEIHSLNNDRARLQAVNQQLAAAYNSLREGQGFLFAYLEGCLHHYGAQDQKCNEYYQAMKSMEQKCGEYHQAWKTMEGKYGSLLNEMHSMATRNLSLHTEIEKADGIAEAANHRAEELDAFCTDLSTTNMSLRLDLNQAREANRALEKRIMELEPSPGVTTGSNNTDIQELESVVRRPEDGDNGLDTQETDTIVVSKRASPSPGDGGLQKANPEHGGQKRNRRGRPRKQNLANPAL